MKLLEAQQEEELTSAPTPPGLTSMNFPRVALVGLWVMRKRMFL